MAGQPLIQEDPALGKLHVHGVSCEGPRFTGKFGNERPAAANMWTRDAPLGQCMNHDIDPKTDT